MRSLNFNVAHLAISVWYLKMLCNFWLQLTFLEAGTSPAPPQKLCIKLVIMFIFLLLLFYCVGNHKSPKRAPLARHTFLSATFKIFIKVEYLTFWYSMFVINQHNNIWVMKTTTTTLLSVLGAPCSTSLNCTSLIQRSWRPVAGVKATHNSRWHDIIRFRSVKVMTTIEDIIYLQASVNSSIRAFSRELSPSRLSLCFSFFPRWSLLAQFY